MQSAELVLKRAWAQLDPETLAYKSFTPGKDGLPPKRTKQYLFPDLFLDSAVSGAMVMTNRDIDDEIASRAEKTIVANHAVLAACVRWHQDMVSFYNGLRQQSTGLFLGDDSGAKLLKPAFSVARLRRGDLSDEERARIVRARVEGMRNSPKLRAPALSREIARDRAGYQRRLDAAWAAESINRPVTLSRTVQRQFDELTHEFSAEKVDRPIVLDERIANHLWGVLIASHEIDAYNSPKSLRLSAVETVAQPSLDRIEDRGVPDHDRRPLDRTIRGRITRMLGNDEGLSVVAEVALGAVIEASAGPYGLARRESRVAMLLGQYLSYSLSDDPQDKNNPGANAIHASWMRSGIVRRMSRNDDGRSSAARNYADGGSDEYYLRRLWGRLLRSEILGRVAITSLAAWDEILGATTSTRNHIVTLTGRGSATTGAPVSSGGADIFIEGPTEIELIVDIIDMGDAHPDRFMARMNAYQPPLTTEGYFEDRSDWNNWSQLYSVSEQNYAGFMLDDLPSFPEAIGRIQRFIAGD